MKDELLTSRYYDYYTVGKHRFDFHLGWKPKNNDDYFLTFHYGRLERFDKDPDYKLIEILLIEFRPSGENIKSKLKDEANFDELKKLLDTPIEELIIEARLWKL